MIIKPENVTKKLDSLGRITLPKGLRDRMGLELNQEMEIFSGEENGIEYILLAKPKKSETIIDSINKINQTFKILGIKEIEIPEEVYQELESIITNE